MIHFEISNTTKFQISQKEIQKIAAACQRVLKNRKKIQISLAIVGNKQMQRLNKEYRGKDESTDVLSFSYPEAGRQEFFGEVIINHIYLRENAKKFGYTKKQEFASLLIHGVVHVFGYDHMKSSQAEEMFMIEKRILNHLI